MGKIAFFASDEEYDGELETLARVECRESDCIRCFDFIVTEIERQSLKERCKSGLGSMTFVRNIALLAACKHRQDPLHVGPSLCTGIARRGVGSEISLEANALTYLSCHFAGGPLVIEKRITGSGHDGGQRSASISRGASDVVECVDAFDGLPQRPATLRCVKNEAFESRVSDSSWRVIENTPTSRRRCRCCRSSARGCC